MNASATIAISGATGMIGSALTERLRREGHTVRRLVRSTSESEPGDIRWNPRAGELNARDLAGCDAIVNLAGEPVAERWTEENMREIRESRVNATSLIARAVGELAEKPRVVLNGSAIGFYGNGGEVQIDEKSVSRGGFLASVVQDWEAAAGPLISSGIRVVFARSGVVLSPHGGALRKLLPPFKLGLGGPIGGGDQWMSWIGLNDCVRAIIHTLFSGFSVRGPVNLVAPRAVRNAQFAHTLGAVLHRPAVMPLPAFALRLAYGQMAEETILWSQRVVPAVLLASGFTFDQPELAGALRLELGKLHQ